MMRLVGGRALELFKGEFRYLQGVSHPNLVQLFALEADAGRWLLTMEFVDGVSFLDHLQPPIDDAAVAETPRPIVTPPLDGDNATGAWVADGMPNLRATFDTEKLRDAFGQLAEGIAALHTFRRIHRDLKPQNVRVGRDGRVVVLDFGLTAALDHTGEHFTSAIMGTAAYMSPEQGGTPPVATTASDWYAFGVMLYQALTGELPFRGRLLLDLLAKKRTKIPQPPRELNPEAPKELETLCMALLDARPENRPTGEQVLRTFGRVESARKTPIAPTDAPLLGRERYLASLRDAYVETAKGTAVVVTVSGPSGIGKSALVKQFLDQLSAEGAVVI
jgi:serine/threonine protein kinase